jgi:hypothetical protein
MSPGQDIPAGGTLVPEAVRGYERNIWREPGSYRIFCSFDLNFSLV